MGSPVRTFYARPALYFPQQSIIVLKEEINVTDILNMVESFYWFIFGFRTYKMHQK